MQSNVADTSFWENELSELPILDMVTDFERAPVLTSAKEVIEFEIDKEYAFAVRNFALDQGHALLPAIVAIFNTCLCRHTTQTDVCIGHKIGSNNEIAIRHEYSGNQSFSELLTIVAKKADNGYAHRSVTHADLVKAARVQPDSRRHLVYQTMLNYYEQSTFPTNEKHPNNLCEFILDIRDAAHGGLSCKLFYSSELYERVTAERFAGHFVTLFRHIASSPLNPLDSHVMLTDEEVMEYTTWNTTDTDFGPFTRVDRMFEEIASRYPNNEAMRLDGQVITFQSMNQAAENLANKLFARGIEVRRVYLIFLLCIACYFSISCFLRAQCTEIDSSIERLCTLDQLFYLLYLL